MTEQHKSQAQIRAEQDAKMLQTLKLSRSNFAVAKETGSVQALATGLERLVAMAIEGIEAEQRS